MSPAEAVYLAAGIALGIVLMMSFEVGEGDSLDGLAFFVIAAWLILGAAAGGLYLVRS